MCAGMEERQTVLFTRPREGETRYACTVCDWQGVRQNIYDHARNKHKLEASIGVRKKKRSLQDIAEQAANSWRAQAERRKAQRSQAKIQSEAVENYPLVVAPVGSIQPCRVLLRSGSGRRVVSRGLLDRDSLDSSKVGVSVVLINACHIGPWLPGGGRTSLQETYTDLVVTESNLQTQKRGPSSGACVALATALLLGCKMVDAGTAVTGAIDLRGRIHRVGAVKDKIMRAFDGEVGQLLVPMRDYEDLEAEEWPSEAAKTYYSTAVKGVTTLVDVLHYAIKGFERQPDMEACLDGPHVGVGICLGLLDDGVGLVEVQCCRLLPGKRELLLTGNFSGSAEMALQTVTALAEADAPRLLAKDNGAAARGPLVLLPRGTDLHVHLHHDYGPVTTIYFMGAAYLSLISLLLGRRPPADVLIYGGVGNMGSLTWGGTAPELPAVYMTDAFRLGYRRLYLGGMCKVTTEAAAEAAILADDGRPRVEIIRKKKMRDAAAAVFGLE